MGLDMYLYAQKSTYLSRYDIKDNPELAASLPNFYPEELKEFKDMIFERNFLSRAERFQIGYWRKANAIHNWIVENCAHGIDECQTIYMSRKSLENLRDCCERTLKEPKNAEAILPTADGFFFGSTEYDEWYFEDITYTKELLDKVLAFLNENDYDIYYEASW